MFMFLIDSALYFRFILPANCMHANVFMEGHFSIKRVATEPNTKTHTINRGREGERKGKFGSEMIGHHQNSCTEENNATKLRNVD